MLEPVRVEARPATDTRCPYCLDALTAPIQTCMECGTALHAACRIDLARCPTRGCAAAVTPRRTRLPEFVPALDRGLTERTTGSRRPAESARARRSTVPLFLALILSGLFVKTFLPCHAFFVAQGFSNRSANRVDALCGMVLLVVLNLLAKLAIRVMACVSRAPTTS